MTFDRARKLLAWRRLTGLLGDAIAEGRDLRPSLPNRKPNHVGDHAHVASGATDRRTSSGPGKHILFHGAVIDRVQPALIVPQPDRVRGDRIVGRLDDAAIPSRADHRAAGAIAETGSFCGIWRRLGDAKPFNDECGDARLSGVE